MPYNQRLPFFCFPMISGSSGLPERKRTASQVRKKEFAEKSTAPPSPFLLTRILLKKKRNQISPKKAKPQKAGYCHRKPKRCQATNSSDEKEGSSFYQQVSKKIFPSLCQIRKGSQVDRKQTCLVPFFSYIKIAA